MPHMSPIMWSLIMMMTFILLMTLLSMTYFSSTPNIPELKKKHMKKIYSLWLW
uniref:ATP synthase F0 subunit 8 n=1 Tax=Tetraclitella divisa TaxID=261885 RepID=A0A0U1WQZ7_9CRUS|nr:ATP synthase F0 subunit 8 [Tetraclitella divisa]AII19590.1 ATP synthase F0 subunit 8 [Tetraclitella divisa]